MRFLIGQIGKVPLLLFMLGTAAFAEDGNISVEPSYVVFKPIGVGQQSSPFTVTVTNKNTAAGTSISMGSLNLKGYNSADYTIEADGCSNTALGGETSCTFDVKLTPQQTGSIKNGWVDIPYTIGSTDSHLSVFLTTKEDVPHEVQRRIPPAISALNIPETMDANSTYDLNWTVVGYQDGYKVAMVMFDCTGVAAGECGDNYNDSNKFYETTLTAPASSEVSNWHYRGVDAYAYTFEDSFAVPEHRADGSDWNYTSIVVRFYVLSDYDENAGKPSISLIIPGNLSNSYYDDSGRKVEKHICPVGGCPL